MEVQPAVNQVETHVFQQQTAARKIMDKYGVQHQSCSEAIEAGYSMAEAANQAGHSNIHTTMISTNPTRQKVKEKANQL